MTENQIKEADACLARAKRAAEQGNRSEAQKYYKKAAAMAEELVKDVRTVQNLRRLEEVYMDLSWMAQSCHQIRPAEEWGKKYLSVCRELYDLISSAEMKKELAYAYQNMGDIGTMKRNLKEAEKYYLISQGMYRELIEETEEKSHAQMEAYRDLATITGMLGQMARAWKDYKVSAERIEESVDLWLYIAEETRMPQDLQKLADYCYNAAIAAAERGEAEKAKGLYEKSGSVYKQLGKQTHTVSFLKEAKSAFRAAGEISGMQVRTGEAYNIRQAHKIPGFIDL